MFTRGRPDGQCDVAVCESCGTREPIPAGEGSPTKWLQEMERIDNYRAELRHVNSSSTPPQTLRVVRFCPDCAPDAKRRRGEARRRGTGGPEGGYVKG